MLKIIICLGIGFFVGTILTTILLCQKNLEQYQQIRAKVDEQVENGKKVYKSQLSEVDDDDFDGQVGIVYDALKSLYDEENKSNYRNAVLSIYKILEEFCADEENEEGNNTEQ